MEKVIGNCGKHPGQSMINCPLCAIEKQKKNRRYYAVEYAGYWHIQYEPYYGGLNIMNAEDMGIAEAEYNAKLIAKLLNEHNN